MSLKAVQFNARISGESEYSSGESQRQCCPGYKITANSVPNRACEIWPPAFEQQAKVGFGTAEACGATKLLT